MLGIGGLIHPDQLAFARSVLRGERHPQIGNAQFFHAATHRFGYNNMHYVLVAGGNAFYEKRKPHLVTQPYPPAPASAPSRGGFGWW